MSKWYEVEVLAMKTIVVELEDGEGDLVEEASSFAASEAFSFCRNVETRNPVLLESARAIEQAKRFADEVCPL